MASRIRRALTKSRVKHTNSVVASKSQSFAFNFPFEITTQILIYASQVHYDGPAQKPEFNVSPLVLCRVSKAWRSYISLQPIFWSRIIISLSQTLRWKHTYIRELYHWLHRAQDMALDVYIVGYLPPGILFATSVAVGIRDFLTSNSSRWRTIDALDLEDTTLIMLPTFFSSAARSPFFTHLQTLVLRTSSPSPRGPFIPSDFRSSPALGALRLVGFTSPFSLASQIFSITTLTLSYNSCDSCCSLLRAFPCLVDADLHYEMDYLTCTCIWDGLWYLPHDHVRSLTIRTRYSDSHMNVPSHLQAPALEDLHISIEGRRSKNCDISGIADLLRESGCRLVRLTLQLSLPEECNIIQLLGLLPGLLELHLRDVEPSAEYSSTLGFSRTFFDALHPHSRNLVLPSLRFLTVGGTLAIDSLDALEGLVLRLRQTWPKGGAAPGPSFSTSVVKLQFAKLQADQKGLNLEEKGSLFASDLKLFMETNILWLINSDGSTWI